MQDQLNIQTPRRVDPGAIDRELRKMWSEASADTSHPVTRARILNLVIFAAAPGLGETSDDDAELASRHPSRTIVVAMNSAASVSGLSAEVSARCNVSFGRRQQICSEQILIRADGRSVDDVHGLVSPLLTSDLRTFLWWRMSGWPLGHSFEVLADHCDRILLDSARIASGAIELGALLALVNELGQRKPSPLPVGDLNWTRLGVWRTALASLYDVPAYREQLVNLKRITIVYNPGGTPKATTDRGDRSSTAASIPIEPMLLAGWLASRLGWGRPQRSTPTQDQQDFAFSFANKNGASLILSAAAGAGVAAPLVKPAGTTVVAQNRSWGVSAIGKILFECEGESTASFSVGLRGSCLETTVVMEGQAMAGRVVACDDKPDGELVAEELDILGNDAVYEDAIRMAATLADLL